MGNRTLPCCRRLRRSVSAAALEKETPPGRPVPLLPPARDTIVRKTLFFPFYENRTNPNYFPVPLEINRKLSCLLLVQEVRAKGPLIMPKQQHYNRSWSQFELPETTEHPSSPPIPTSAELSKAAIAKP